MSNNLKDRKIGSKAIRDRSSYNNINNNKNSGNILKDSWNSNSQSYGEEYLSEFSWPPRSYTCSFCKREFRSAQALGGHMNVHRRDRARLRLSPPRDGQYPFLSLNLSPNPNPNFSTPALVSPSFALPSLISPPLSSLSSLSSSTSLSDMKRWGMDGTQTDPLNPKYSKRKSAKSFSLVEESDDFTEDGCKVSKKADILRLDLEIGLTSDSKEDLDLELRLGY